MRTTRGHMSVYGTLQITTTANVKRKTNSLTITTWSFPPVSPIRIAATSYLSLPNTATPCYIPAAYFFSSVGPAPPVVGKPIKILK